MHRDVRRTDASPNENSPVRGGRKTRQPLLLTDPLSFSSTRYENDDDYMSPASVSNHSPSRRYNAAAAAAAAAAGGGASDDSCESNFNVVIRVRPPVPRELEGYRPFVDVVRISKDNRLITLCETLDTEDGRGGVYSRQTFTFDHVYDTQAPQREVYERSAQPAVLSVLQGYNATLMAYGQTGTGKTYTMEGFTSEEQRGIIPRSIEEVFASIDVNRHENMRFLVRASYMQIYNEVISDLLKPATTRALSVRHTPQRGVYVEGLSEWVVRTPHDVYGLIERGTSLRATSTTRMSELSSRSHAMFTIIVEVMEGDESNPTSYRFGKLNIVDLAGSEKVRQACVSGQRLEETKKINKSLHELGNVISALANKNGGRNRHVPFRNSVLTSALRDSLGGNCKTTLIACISPALESYTESLSTLVFSNRAKNIKNTAVINEDVDQATLLRKYEQELKKLRLQLQEQEAGMQVGGVDAGLVSELRQGMRRAKEDREAALEALHESSRAHQHEQAVRKRFEERIQELELILQNGGFKGGPPRTSDEYALRLDELDRERRVMEEDKAQVDRYKQLLLKQRDIMLNLTTRLNERDETILQLQEEVDAYDAHIQTLEDALETLQGQVQQKRSVNGSPNGKPTASISKAQAEEYLQRVRVSPCSGEGRYRSDVNSSQLLTAEEKMLELLLANPASPQPPAAATTTTTRTLLDGETKRHLTELVRERAEMIVWRQLDTHLLRLRGEMEHLQDELLASEQRRHTLEQMMDAAKVQHPAFQETITRTRRHIDEQQEIVRRAYEGRIQALQQQLAQEREQRMRLAGEVDMLSVESRRALEHCTTAVQRVEINDVCAMLRHLEENIIDETKRSIGETVARAVAARGTNNNNNNSSSKTDVGSANGAVAALAISSPTASSPSSLNVTARELEDQLRALQGSHAQREEEWRRVVKEKDNTVLKLEELLRDAHASRREEIATLTKSLNTHKKDRRALHTIMEQRIKTKVDMMCELLTEEPQLLLQERNRICTEACALQNLVNASLKAMES